jgi:hypothetical protein
MLALRDTPPTDQATPGWRAFFSLSSFIQGPALHIFMSRIFFAI